MPGVPTGRACEECRKQKKKVSLNLKKSHDPLIVLHTVKTINPDYTQCDEKQPSCSRCLRLKLQCVGSGQQRFKFQQEKRFTCTHVTVHTKSQSSSPARSSESPEVITNASDSVFKVLMPTKPDPIQIRLPPDSPASNPTSDIFSLTSRFIHTIQRTTDLRYNLWWTFGTFLEDVPRRLGANEALDRSVEALAAAHAGFCGLSRTGATVEALTKYSQALRTLRVYLDDRVHAQTSNTLCAVMILLICQLFLGQSNQCWSGHAEGATQILRARKRHKPRDLFEQKLFLSLRGSIVGSSPFLVFANT